MKTSSAPQHPARLSILTAAVVLWLAAPAALRAQETPPSITLGVHQPLALPLLQDDPTAIDGNPATLGFAGGFHLDLTTQSDAVGTRVANGAYASVGSSSHAEWGINIAYGYEGIEPQAACDYAHPCDTRSSWALALRAGWFALGAQVHSFSSRENAGLDGLVSWDVGASVRPLSWLALGGAVFDANAPRIASSALPVRYQASLAARPFGTDRLTLELDANVTSCSGTPAFWSASAPRACGAGSPDLRASIELRALDGLRLLGAVQRTPGDDRWIAEMGLAFDLGNFGVRFAGTGARGYSYLSANAHLSSERYAQAGFLSALTDAALELNLTAALERKRPDPIALLFGEAPPDPLTRTIETLRRLRRDPRLRALVLTVNGLNTSLAGAEELRHEIAALRASGKKVVFLLENGGDLEYYLASSADRVFATPQAILDINGFSATVFFAAAGLDKLGVKAEFFRVGAYKNAPDLFTRSDMSAEQREVETSLLGDIVSRYAKAVAEERGVDEVKFRGLLDQGILAPQEAVDAKLLDGLVYEDQLEGEVEKLIGRRARLQAVSTDPIDRREVRWGGRPKIVLIRVEGEIGMEDQAQTLFTGSSQGARSIAKRIREAADDSGTAAIVVRIDSPGGDGNASDMIWRELVRARREKGKPVVVSMGEYAASGGYYVAAAGDAIWAEPSTITGSIGVFAGHFDASELLAKLGVAAETVKTNPSADLEMPTRALTPKERARMQRLVDGFYKEFVAKVADGRHLSVEEVDAIARGRVWSGSQAKARGLVDRLGGLADAIQDAKARAHLSAEADIDLDDLRNVGDSGEAGRGMQTALRAMGLEHFLSALGMPLPSLPPALDGVLQGGLRSLDALGSPNTVRARLPYSIDVH